MQVKWQGKFNLALKDKTWHTIYKICFKTIYDNSVIWFQYKIQITVDSVGKMLKQSNIFSLNVKLLKICGLI